ncbi:MAG: hypothetical protein ABI776_06175 [Nocardioidaceae bacterium]
MTILQQTPWRLIEAAASWPVTSQHQARRNALVASTALAEQRRERIDVEEFLAGYVALLEPSADVDPAVGHTA